MTKRLSSLLFLKQLMRQLKSSSIFDGAAALSFYFLLATLPALMLILILLSFFSLQDLEQQLLLLLQHVPDDVQTVLLRALREFKSKNGIKLHALSIAAVTAVWTVSNGITAAVRQIDQVHKSHRRRGAIANRLSSVVLIMIICFTGLVSLLILVFGKTLHKLETFNGIPLADTGLFSALTLLSLFILIFISGLSLYRLSVKEKLKHLIPGALFTTVSSMVLTHIFGLYVKKMAHYSDIYGSLAAVIVMLFWFYLIGFLLILGAEINVAIRQTLSKQ